MRNVWQVWIDANQVIKEIFKEKIKIESSLKLVLNEEELITRCSTININTQGICSHYRRI